MLQWLYKHVASACFICLGRMLQVFYLDVAYVLVALYICCKRVFKMFHLFQTYVASILSGCCICCSCYTHMLQIYIVNASHVSDVCCRSASCCKISRCSEQAHAEAVPAGVAVTTCVANEVDVGGLHLHAHHQARGGHH